jgi:hypothetical protein
MYVQTLYRVLREQVNDRFFSSPQMILKSWDLRTLVTEKGLEVREYTEHILIKAGEEIEEKE